MPLPYSGFSKIGVQINFHAFGVRGKRIPDLSQGTL
jgi:hypothetical protein